MRCTHRVVADALRKNMCAHLQVTLYERARQRLRRRHLLAALAIVCVGDRGTVRIRTVPVGTGIVGVGGGAVSWTRVPGAGVCWLLGDVEREGAGQRRGAPVERRSNV